MSRAQQGDVIQQASGENQSYNQNAQTAFNNAQTDVNNYGTQLSQFAAANPYGQGGQLQTTQNQVESNTADAAAKAAGQALQSQAVRTGQNAGGAVAATEATEQANERNLSGQEATANQTRIGDQAKYNQTALQGQQNLTNMQDTLAQQQGAAAQGALGTQETAAQTPSFMDELGQGLISAGVGAATGFGSGFGAQAAKCWIAAELYGGWEDPRTVLVRQWLTDDFGKRWTGQLVLRAYSAWGIETAKAIRSRTRVGKTLRRFFRWLFDAGLAKARVWESKKANAGPSAPLKNAALRMTSESEARRG